MEFLNVVRYTEAIEKILVHMPKMSTEKVSLLKANGRVLAEDIYSPEDQPPFNRSSVDGYAVDAQDTFGSSESIPAFLSLEGEVLMGQKTESEIISGQCVWIPTGGMLPKGSNAVIMVEYTEKLDDTTVLIHRPVSPGENVMFKGEDVKAGELLYKAGNILRPQDIGMLAALGISEIMVYVPLKVGIISTGDEIVDIKELPAIGKIRDVNTYTLASAVESCGAITKTYPVIRDDYKALREMVDLALKENDLLIMSGGSSVGIMDTTLEVLKNLPDSKLLFHGIAVKPGKPTMAVSIDDKLIIGLPGHPVSALTMFNVVCKPVLSKQTVNKIIAYIDSNLASQAGRDDFIPVKLWKNKTQTFATPLLGKSGLLSILTKADGYIKVDYEKQGLLKGEEVEVFLFY